MQGLRAHMRRWWHVHALVLIVIGALIVTLIGAFAGGAVWKRVNGQPLSPTGQRLYHHLDKYDVEQGGSESPPAAVAARLARAAASVPTLRPRTLATPEPVTFRAPVRNYSSRAQGAHPILLVVHDAEMPNAPGLQDLRALAAWFNNPAAQASSNYGTDAQGNTVEMVPTSRKAWAQAWFNSWAISDELLGYASQTSWPVAQLRAVAELYARDAIEYGIPIQRGAVSGCTITRAGIVEHRDLGACGGGHHDAGPDFPLSRFIAMVKQYAAAIRHPVARTRPKHVTKSKRRRCAVRQIQYALNTRAHVRPRLALDGVAGPLTRRAYVKAGGTTGLRLTCIRPW